MVVWLVLATGTNGVVVPMKFKSTLKYTTKAECVAYLDKVADRMPDYLRGAIGTSLTTEVVIRGKCEQEGRPA